ncbi:MAG: GNAT family N-acetyltransferase [Chloroflexi bacterium]|nr:GNAT family N-acetyltransferase [Chloroflexota bacterium]
MAKETEGKILDIEVVRPGVEAVLTRNDLGFYLIAEHSGRPAGQLLITYEWSDWRNSFFWWIQSVYVVPEFRRLGVYKALHYYAAEDARRQGDVRGLRLYVDKDNTIAQGVYAGLRMRPTHYDMYEIDFDARPEVKLPEEGPPEEGPLQEEQKENDDATG